MALRSACCRRNLVFASFGLHDAADVLRAVDSTNPELDDLACAQTCAVAESKQHVNLGAPHHGHEAFGLIQARLHSVRLSQGGLATNGVSWRHSLFETLNPRQMPRSSWPLPLQCCLQCLSPDRPRLCRLPLL